MDSVSFGQEQKPIAVPANDAGSRGDLPPLNLSALASSPRLTNGLEGFDRLIRQNTRAVVFPKVGDRLGNFSLVA